MTDKFSEEDRIQLANYRISRAFETLREADYTAEAGFYNAAVNRLYYAVYYAINAMLISIDVTAGTHQGVKTLFSLHFIRTGLLPQKMSRLFNQLMESRHSSDYDDFASADAELFDSFRPGVQELLDAAKVIVESNS